MAEPGEAAEGVSRKVALRIIKRAIWATHGVKSRLFSREHVVEMFEGEIVWQGEVLIFSLIDHPTSHCCYAWEVDGEVTAVLHQGPVDGPQAAVRAAIMATGEGGPEAG